MCSTKMRIAKANRHLSQAHKELTTDQRLRIEEIMKSQKKYEEHEEDLEKEMQDQETNKQDEKKAKTKPKPKPSVKPSRRCCICETETTNIWAHLNKKHKMAYKSEQFEASIKKVSNMIFK